MAVFGKGGTASGAVTCSASTRPSASRRPTSIGSSRGTAPKIAACTSASGISGTEPTRLTSRQLVAHQRAQVVGELGSEIGPREGELDVGAEEVELLADVVATVREHAAEHRLRFDEQ